MRPLHYLLPLALVAAAPATARAPATTAITAPAAMVSAADPRAVEAGLAMLRQGGNAMDAAIATMLALAVVEPQSSGIGGGSVMVYQSATEKLPAMFDGRETAPAAATGTLFTDANGVTQTFHDAVPGGRSVGIPGNVAMIALAHKRYGKLPWAKLFDPAIALARDGYDVSPRMAKSIAGSRDTLARTRPAATLFLHADGTPKAAGEHIVNEDLARSLELIAAAGPPGFYTGTTARAIVAAVTTAPTNKSTMTLADLAGYQAKLRAAVCGPYRSYRICSVGPPSAGGLAVITILGQLEGFDMARFGPGSATGWHLLAESERLAFADRAAYGGDSDFVTVPMAGLLDPAYIKSRASLIRVNGTMAHVAPGRPAGVTARLAPPTNEVPSTTDVAVADAQGNVASVTTTVEGPFGSSLVANGFVLNNQLTDFDFVPTKDGKPSNNRVQGGKRPRTSMSPSIVYDAAGRVVLVVGAAGGPTIPAQVAKAIIGVLDWKLSIQDAIALPLVYAADDLLLLEQSPEGAPLVTLEPGLKALGHTTAQYSMPLKANGLERVPGGWRGGADPRSEGVALGL